MRETCNAVFPTSLLLVLQYMSVTDLMLLKTIPNTLSSRAWMSGWCFEWGWEGGCLDPVSQSLSLFLSFCLSLSETPASTQSRRGGRGGENKWNSFCNHMLLIEPLQQLPFLSCGRCMCSFHHLWPHSYFLYATEREQKRGIWERWRRRISFTTSGLLIERKRESERELTACQVNANER